MAVLNTIKTKVEQLTEPDDSPTATVRVSDKKFGEKTLAELLTADTKDAVPTGLVKFDEVNAGLLRGSLVVIAAPTGSGKSSLAFQMVLNIMTQSNPYQACIAPLEMAKAHVYGSILSNYAGISKSKTLTKTLGLNEKKLLRKADRNLRNVLHKNKCELIIQEFERGASVESILSGREGEGDDVIFIDQLTLTRNAFASGGRAEYQWASMGEGCKVANQWAARTGTTVVMLTQLDDEGNVKYSRGVLEHADLALVWKRGKVLEDVATMSVRTRKVRLQQYMEFPLTIDITTGKITDADSDTPTEPDPKERKIKRQNTKGKKKKDEPIEIVGDLDEYLDD